MSALFDPVRVGRFTLPNRIIMAPLTRGRTGDAGIPGEMVAKYYAQRASAGLIISEATAVNRQGDGWPGAPGIYTEAQVAGWRGVADAVHAAGGRIFVQLWHMGRVVVPGDIGCEHPVSPSAIAAVGDNRGKDGVGRPFTVPRAMTEADIGRTIADFCHAAELAISAGIDGVEIHGANGFLIDSFLRDGTNQRVDAYGGSPENRARFLIDAVDAVAGAIGSDRVGVRISPTNTVFGISDSVPAITFPIAAKMLNQFNLAYLHVLEAESGSDHPMATGLPSVTPLLRDSFDGPVIVNGGYDRRRAAAAIADGAADAVAFGIPFIANPDLVARFRNGLPLAEADSNTFYTPGGAGYIDYPAHPIAA